jgi:hypothetical protein
MTTGRRQVCRRNIVLHWAFYFLFFSFSNYKDNVLIGNRMYGIGVSWRAMYGRDSVSSEQSNSQRSTLTFPFKRAAAMFLDL